MKLGLAFKFSLLTAVILAVSFFALGFSFINRQKTILFHDIEKLSTSLATNLAANSAYGLVLHDKGQLRSLLKSLKHVEDIKFSWIEDSSGEILASSSNILPELLRKVKKHMHGIKRRSGSDGQGAVMSTGKKAVVHSMEDVPEFLIVTAPVIEPRPTTKEALVLGSSESHEKKVFLGRVVLGISLERVDRNLEDARKHSLFIIAVVAAISVSLTIFLVHLITKPLSDLTRATKQVMAGVTPPFVDVKSKDEIGELARAFNQMIRQLMSGKEALEKAYSELEQANIGLEETVAERTKALKETIEELVVARDELEAAYNEMKNMYQAKAAFLRTASHELRTPLTAIKANIDYMWTYLMDKLDQESTEIIEAIRKNARHMHSMVEDMLTMLRIDSETMPLNIERVNLRQLVIEALSELKALQEDRVINLDIPEDLEMECDSARFHDLCFNLLGNAYKFTENNGVITITAEKKADIVTFVVEDNGQGIPGDQVRHIFEPFFQAQHGRQGSGLGLAIVKTIIDKHHGKIECHSRYGEGTRFVISMPATFFPQDSSFPEQKDQRAG